MEILLYIAIFMVCFIKNIDGHAYFSSIAVDGTQYAEGVCIRPHPGSKYDYPISDIDNPNGINSADMTCGFLPAAGKAANKKCPVNPGSKIDIQWHYEMGLGNSDTFIIDPSHHGPCIVYMAKSETGAGNVWFKIFEDGYDTSTKKWCVDKLRANKGKFSITIPTDITPGNYLMRVELIALHEGFELGGAQPYVHCAEITVGGSGTVNPGNLVAFPGAYKASDKGLFFDIYPVKGTYPIPGPALYVSGAGTGTPIGDATTSPKPLTTANRVVTTKQGTSKSITTKQVSVTTKSITTKQQNSVTTKKVSTPITSGDRSLTTAIIQTVTTKARRTPTTSPDITTSDLIATLPDSTSSENLTTGEEVEVTTEDVSNNQNEGVANGVNMLYPGVITTLILASMGLFL